VKLLADAKQIKLLTEGPMERLWVRADAQRIEQVLDNLLSNALKFGPDGSVVRLVVEPDQKSGVLRISVIDGGPGVPRDELPHLFERFYQGRAKVKQKSAGSGLGLALAKKVVEAHGGRIWIESEVGKGTIVRFTLRIARPQGQL
jgi:two-component system sensor histidine kinase GlrK